MPVSSTTATTAAHSVARVVTRLSLAARTVAVIGYQRWRAWYDAAGSPRARLARGAVGAWIIASVAVAPGLIGYATVRLMIASVATVPGGLLHAARRLLRDPIGHSGYDLTVTVGRPARTWLQQHAAALPASPELLAWSWLLLATLLYTAARRGSLAARFAWAALGTATGAAVWQASAADSRSAAVAVTAGAWLLLAPSAYARTQKPPRRQEVRLESTLAAYVVQQLVMSAAPVDPTSADSTAPTDAPGAGIPRQAVSEPAAPALPEVSGFRCRYCDHAVVWSGAHNAPARTWRSPNGGTYCPQAPDLESGVVGQAHIAL